MTNDNNNFNWPKLHDLSVKDIGGAQLAAGENIYDLYFRGDSMQDKSARAATPWACDLSSELGSSFFLETFGVGTVCRSARARRQQEGGEECGNCRAAN